MRRKSRIAILGFALGLGLSIAPVAQGFGQIQVATTESAVDAARLAKLEETLQFGPFLAVIREEGLALGTGLDQDMLGGTGGVAWKSAVARAYEARAARVVLDRVLTEKLAQDPQTVTAIETFYQADLGQKILGLELAARRSLLDAGTRDSAELSWLDMQAKGGHRVDQLALLVKSTGMIDQNVQGALNAEMALYRGMGEGGGFKKPMAEADLTAQVAAHEPQARADAEARLMPMLALAYQSLTDDELDQFSQYMTSTAGHKAGLALYAAFDVLFTGIAHDLGLAAGHRIAGQNI